MTAPEALDEAARQQALMRMIAEAGSAGVMQGDVGAASDRAPEGRLRLADPARRARDGLAIYRVNAAALAERALGAAYPTLRALLGAADFRQMAREHWRDHPPQRGDIGEWGQSLPGWLRDYTPLAPWPYLADCAQLDGLRHACERAHDAELDARSLGLLEHADPARLRLLLRPGTDVMTSAWPVASIFEAHQVATADFDAAREAIAKRQAQAVLVARRGWRAQVHRVDKGTCRWVNELLAGRSIAAALDRVGADFDFTAWLADALREEWLQGVAYCDDSTAAVAAVARCGD